MITLTGADTELYHALKHHDWCFNYSDDIRVWRRGSISLERIYGLIVGMGLARAKEIWTMAAPPGFPYPGEIQLGHYCYKR